jgi:hypothetical protein
MSAKLPPNIAPMNKLGAKTPPDPPEETVKVKAIIFANIRRRRMKSVSRPCIANWIQP